MDDVCSQYDSRYSLSYILCEKENNIFDRKSAKSKPSSLADDISAFANAEGGVLVVGISDNRELEGVNSLTDTQLSDLVESPKNVCKPMPIYQVEFLPIVNKCGHKDRLLLLHIKPARDYLIRTSKDDTYLRIEDRSVLMKGDNLHQLENQKNLRHFEDTLNHDVSIHDLNDSLIKDYKRKVGAENISTEQVLTARGMMRNGCLTMAAVLLFADNIRQFYPNCRVRFIRYEGSVAMAGTKLNIIKDQIFEEPILRLIEKTKTFISSQLRDFTTLNPQSGRFETTPEYPEFAWQEGIINAITHREYAYAGDYIRVCMYDDRLEIESPGRLPYPVTIQNIKDTRSSRNPVIARVLYEMGWVRELNEGVKRIFADMAELFLLPPVYKEREGASSSLKLILTNNILVRHTRFKDNALKSVGIEVWTQLDDLEKKILMYMVHSQNVKNSDLVTHTGFAPNTIQRRINHLLQLKVITSHGKLRDPQRYYCLSIFN